MSKTHHEHRFIYNSKTGKWEKKKKEVSSVGLPKWPLHCEALAVHPDQIEEAVEFDRQNGVPTEYDQAGCPVISGPGHYRDYQKLHGVHQKNAYN